MLLSAIEVDGQFAAERGGRAAALALPQRRSAVCVRRASQREPLGAEKPRAHEPQRRETDALALNQLDTLLWRHVTATHPLAVVNSACEEHGVLLLAF